MVDKIVAVAVGVTVVAAVEGGAAATAAAVVVEEAGVAAVAGVDATEVVVVETGTIGALTAVIVVAVGADADVPTLAIAVFKRSVDTTPTGVDTVVAPAGIESGVVFVVAVDAAGVVVTGDD